MSSGHRGGSKKKMEEWGGWTEERGKLEKKIFQSHRKCKLKRRDKKFRQKLDFSSTSSCFFFFRFVIVVVVVWGKTKCKIKVVRRPWWLVEGRRGCEECPGEDQPEIN